MKKECVKKITSIGGQALLEGIMMRGPKKISVAVRNKDKNIDVEELKSTFFTKKFKFYSWPFIRGVINFIDSMIIGQKAMQMSIEKSGALDDNSSEEPSKFERFLEDKFGSNLFKILMGISTVIGVGISLFLFMFLPTFLFNSVFVHIFGAENNNFLRSAFEGVMKIVIFLLYIVLCSQMKEMKKLFQYHGAEHKTIFCYESGEELTVENVKKHIRFHPRCGTSFLVLMLVVGIVIGLFIPIKQAFFRTIVRLLCVPLLVGIGYELLKICSKYDNLITKIIAAPGLWMQRITTKEPTDDMIEVAICAIKEVIPENGEDIVNELK